MDGYTPQEIREEQEANAFACFLLMPTFLLEPELAKRHEHEGEGQLIERLAKVFQVEQWVVVMRLSLYQQEIIERKENISTGK